MRILIAGASGNLGSRIARHLLGGPHELRLLVHRTPLPADLAADARVACVQADLDVPASLAAACAGVDVVVYVAGVLFRPRPQTFLHRTNTLYVRNVVDASLRAGVRRFVLLSFPHVEGASTPEARATGTLQARPTSLHSRTRLAAEQYLFGACAGSALAPVVLRAGVVYGPGVKLIEAARALMEKRLLAVWREPTWLHLLALPDLLRVVARSVEDERLSGIYNVADDGPLTMQEFLDRLARHWALRRPRRLPAFSFRAAAIACEAFATVFHTAAPLTRDILEMGMTSVVADTTRMKREIAPQLLYPTLEQGLALL